MPPDSMKRKYQYTRCICKIKAPSDSYTNKVIMAPQYNRAPRQPSKIHPNYGANTASTVHEDELYICNMVLLSDHSGLHDQELFI